MSTNPSPYSLEDHEVVVASFIEDNAEDASEAPEEIYTEGANQLEQHVHHALHILPSIRLARTDTHHTSYSAVFGSAKLVEPFSDFCTRVRSSRSLGKAKIRAIGCYRQSAGPVTHRFLLLHLRRRGRSDIWLRIDRQLAPNLTLPKFFARHFQSAANDSISMAGSPDALIKDAVRENHMRFWSWSRLGNPTLSDLSEILESVRDNLPEYKLWPENCWMMCSLLQDILYRSHEGYYEHGDPILPNLAAPVRQRITLDLIRNSGLTNKERLPQLQDLIPGVAEHNMLFDLETKRLLENFSNTHRSFQRRLPLTTRRDPLKLALAAATISTHLSDLGYVSAARDANAIVVHAVHVFDPLRPLNQSLLRSLLRTIIQPNRPLQLAHTDSDVLLLVDSMRPHDSYYDSYLARLDRVRLSEYLYHRDPSSHSKILASSLESLGIYADNLNKPQAQAAYNQAISLRRIYAIEEPVQLAVVLWFYGRFLLHGMEDQHGALEKISEVIKLCHTTSSESHPSTILNPHMLERCADVLYDLGCLDKAWNLDAEILTYHRAQYSRDGTPNWSLRDSLYRNASNFMTQHQWSAARDLLTKMLDPQHWTLEDQVEAKSVFITKGVLGILCCLEKDMDCSGNVRKMVNVFGKETLQFKQYWWHGSDSISKVTRDIWLAIASELQGYGVEELAVRIRRALDQEVWQRSRYGGFEVDGEDDDFV